MITILIIIAFLIDKSVLNKLKAIKATNTYNTKLYGTISLILIAVFITLTT